MCWGLVFPLPGQVPNFRGVGSAKFLTFYGGLLEQVRKQKGKKSVRMRGKREKGKEQGRNS
jgi:hypothetical protein